MANGLPCYTRTNGFVIWKDGQLMTAPSLSQSNQQPPAHFAGYASFKPLLAPLEQPLQAIRQRLIDLNPPETKPLAESMAYTLETPGKLMRPALTLLCYQVLTQQEDCPHPVLETATVSELIHVATLLHDDVLDESDTRRGRATVRQKFGNTLAILGGDWLLAQASIKLSELGHLKLVKLYAEVLASLCNGEVEQLRGSYTLEQSNWDQYWTKSRGKTACLFAAGCKSAAYLAEQDEATQEAFSLFGEKLGLAFQLVDDSLDYEASVQQLGKPALADLQQGLLNAPVLLALESKHLSNEQRAELRLALEAGFAADDPKAREKALKPVQGLLEQAQALEATRQLASQLLEEGLEQLASVPHSPFKERLQTLARQLVTRRA